jgi:hypothetical protein
MDGAAPDAWDWVVDERDQRRSRSFLGTVIEQLH